MTDENNTDSNTELMPAIVANANEAGMLCLDADERGLLVASLRPIAMRLGHYQDLADRKPITAQSEADVLAEALGVIASDEKRLAEVVDRHVSRAHALHKAWTGFRNRFPLADYSKRIKRKIGDWEAEKRRRAAEEQRRLQAEADEKARKEREALERKAQAMKTEAKREEYRERAEMVSAPVVAVTPEKTSGVKLRESWRFAIEDAAAIPREYLVPDEKAIGAVVRAMKGRTNIPGVRVWSDLV